MKQAKQQQMGMMLVEMHRTNKQRQLSEHRLLL